VLYYKELEQRWISIVAKDLFGQEIEIDLFGTPKVPFTKFRERRNDLTAEFVRSILRYDPDTGFWTWIAKPNDKSPYLPGMRAGHRGQICINWIKYKTTHLAFLYMTGEWPPNMVDHENLEPFDDRWKNLRLANRSQNTNNSGPRSNNKSGYKGVYFENKSKKYYAKITVDGVTRYLGPFGKKEDAAIAYVNAAIKYHGEFARAQYSPKKDLF
jgi:HNH endonuclease/AP2 domain